MRLIPCFTSLPLNALSEMWFLSHRLHANLAAILDNGWNRLTPEQLRSFTSYR